LSTLDILVENTFIKLIFIIIYKIVLGL